MGKSGDSQKGNERIGGEGAFVKEVLAHTSRLRAEGYEMGKTLCGVSQLIGIRPAHI